MTTNNQQPTANSYEPVIGLEVHVELSTRSKMFCTCSADYFGKEPNTHTCPICLGLPGALPVANKVALENCAKIGLALGCTVSEESRFERKNYFYPDLPKGFQISQYRWPLCKDGLVVVSGGKGKREIRINRVHQEEDTAKMTHIAYSKSQIDEQLAISNSQFATLIDYNRSGVPLVEIVTEPDFRDTEEIRDYAKKLQQICRYLGVSNADMEKGDMRLEANVSVRTLGLHLEGGRTKLPSYRVELKNINSFRFMVAAVEYEIKRQIAALEKGERLVQETRGWDENKKQTYTQRVKEEANDYRYFPEPDLPKVIMNSDSVRKIKEEMPELPEEKIARLVKEYSLSLSQAITLADTQEFADYFEEAVRAVNSLSISLSKQKIANTLINKKFDRNKILPVEFTKVLAEETEKPAISKMQVEEIADKVIAENPQVVADYKKGKFAAIHRLVAGVMAHSKGSASPQVALEILERKLSS
ncbi:MAG: Asp-tRNA(Asn)/Glu-tRNA(Gln) amidotransferase subunit GatB [Candidatus Blackburnbacteria bacterium]|nr:Asp-tRNA(Asn)/Glu-tRNA(Gln) amidotransferase subunit GatB [Candidatus Blackburnbacteria bacterium]